MDRRKYINFATLHRMKEIFVNRLEGYETHIIMGNHDIYYKGTSEVNALKLLIGENSNIKWYSNTSDVIVGDQCYCFVPWINEANYDSSIRGIQKSNAEYAFGHLELQGFEMDGGHFCTHGMGASLFRKFKKVFTGHFHQMSEQKNVKYLGAPYHMKWGDYPSPRGFHIFDTETGETEFFRNPESLFLMINYDDRAGPVDVSDCDFKDKYVKVLVESKTDVIGYENFLSYIDAQGPEDVRIIECFNYTEEIYSINTHSTTEIINQTIDFTDTTCDKDKLKRRINEVYSIALEAKNEFSE